MHLKTYFPFENALLEISFFVQVPALDPFLNSFCEIYIILTFLNIYQPIFHTINKSYVIFCNQHIIFFNIILISQKCH